MRGIVGPKSENPNFGETGKSSVSIPDPPYQCLLARMATFILFG